MHIAQAHAQALTWPNPRAIRHILPISSPAQPLSPIPSLPLPPPDDVNKSRSFEKAQVVK